jgi:hypothetical protein
MLIVNLQDRNASEIFRRADDQVAQQALPAQRHHRGNLSPQHCRGEFDEFAKRAPRPFGREDCGFQHSPTGTNEGEKKER